MDLEEKIKIIARHNCIKCGLEWEETKRWGSKFVLGQFHSSNHLAWLRKWVQLV